MVSYERLKTKEKSGWVIPKVVAVAYGAVTYYSFSFIKQVEVTVQTGFHIGGRN